MSEMIERVAKAIRDTNANTIGLTFTELSRAIARAAIEAMREPTQLELYPGVSAYIKVEQRCRPVAFRAGWNAVIDAALSQNTLHSSSSAEPPRVADAQAGGEASPPVVSPPAAQFPE